LHSQLIPDISTATERAIALFRYREEATQRRLPHDPDWDRVIRRSYAAALAGARGVTDQEQCAYQAIRLAVWESGQVAAPWTKAFGVPAPVPQPAPVVIQPEITVAPQPALPWYRLWRREIVARVRSLLRRWTDRINAFRKRRNT
jgi:hypothetical protein